MASPSPVMASAEPEASPTSATKSVATLRSLQAQGKVGSIGITGLPLEIYRAVMDRAEVDVILSYCHYTLFDTSLETILPELETQRVGIINASPLSMGLLANPGPPDWHPASQPVRVACAEAAAYCRSQGADISQLALSFALQNLKITTTLVGIASREQLHRNDGCVGTPPDPELLSKVQSILSPVHNVTWPSDYPESK